MVLISSKKYACETCIKGHRSSACKHTDRPLFEIKKKGRPVTQCEHCRELRKTKQVHVKCMCESKEESAGAMSSGTSKKGTAKMLDSAAFPHGLPDPSDSSALLTEGLSSDSELGGEPHVCTCGLASECKCCTPRKSAPRNRRRTSFGSPAAEASHTASESNAKGKRVASSLTTDSSHILARIAELRPVLPRPSSSDVPAPGPAHSPSSTSPHGHPKRHHNYEDMFFSPYGRAYEYTHGRESDYESYFDRDAQPQNPPAPLPPSQGPSFSNQYPPDGNNTSWVAPMRYDANFPSMCGCGDDCGCPGCAEHNGSRSTSTPAAFAACTNPATCGMCLDCTILSLPPAIPPNTALSIYDPLQADAIDEWLRQVSTPANPSSDPFQSMIGQTYAPPPWNNLAVPNISVPQADNSLLPGGRCADCGRPAGLCECDNERFGDSGSSEESSYTFATSGERLPGFGTSAERSGAVASMERRAALDRNNSGSYLSVPEPPRSRSSSLSSQSSRSGAPLSRVAGPSVPLGRVQSPPKGPGSVHKKTPSLPAGAGARSYSHGSQGMLGVGGAGLFRTPPALSPSPGPSAAQDVIYASSNPDSERSEDAYSQYDPSLDSMRL